MGMFVAYRDYIRSGKWHIVSALAKKRVGNRCQVCNSSSQLAAHHRTYERLGDEMDTDLTVLCAECHALHHAKMPSPMVQWMAQCAASTPLIYNIFVAQAEQASIGPDGSVWLTFGVDSTKAIDRFDGTEIAGRTVKVLRHSYPTGVLAEHVDEQNQIHLQLREPRRPMASGEHA